MLKPILDKFFQYRNVVAKNGLDIVLLTKGYNSKYYRVKEYIGQVVSIQSGKGFNGMDKIEIKFLNNERYQTETYLDNNIREGDIISIYGIFIKDGTKLQLQCKGGSIRVFNKFSEAGRIDTNKIYKFGYAELSNIEPSVEYNVGEENIKELEPNRLWFYVGNDIKDIEDKAKLTEQEEKNGIIDTTTTSSFCVPEVQEINDIDIEF